VPPEAARINAGSRGQFRGTCAKRTARGTNRAYGAVTVYSRFQRVR